MVQLLLILIFRFISPRWCRKFPVLQWFLYFSSCIFSTAMATDVHTSAAQSRKFWILESFAKLFLLCYQILMFIRFRELFRANHKLAILSHFWWLQTRNFLRWKIHFQGSFPLHCHIVWSVQPYQFMWHIISTLEQLFYATNEHSEFRRSRRRKVTELNFLQQAALILSLNISE